MPTSLQQLTEMMREYGATRFYAKRLAPNDNSKNQVYLGGDFSALNLIPHGEIYTDASVHAGSKRDRAKADVRFFWVGKNGKYVAPYANLILYPKYPEVRMSGFLKGCKHAPSEVMTSRTADRVLVLGIAPDGTVLAFAAFADHPVAKEVNATLWPTSGVFDELPISPDHKSSRAVLLSELRRIFQLGWIRSQKLSTTGEKQPYAARNGGGYTLEAELGVSPNGYAGPDFLGWEIKQYGVTDFKNFRPKSPVTLMTPEPTGGIYRDEGVAAFLHRFGYADKSGKTDRINFGGIYACGRSNHPETGLKLELEGFDSVAGKILDMAGRILLTDQEGRCAASWSFAGIMDHWDRKHAQAAYLPSLFRTPPPEYAYGQKALLCEQTDFLLFLKAVASGSVYYDPGIKAENASSAKPQIKRRSQFRIKHDDLTKMYHRCSVESLV